jgi:hypothetical protein
MNELQQRAYSCSSEMPMDVPAAAWTAFFGSNTFDTPSSQLTSIYYDMTIIIQSSLHRVFIMFTF